MKTGSSRIVIALAITLGLGGCAAGPFARVDRPARSPAATVALAGQACSRENDPNWSEADILGLDLQLRVENAGAAPLAFYPARVALLAGGQSYTPRRSDPAGTVVSGGSRTFVVHFWERNGDLACDIPMALAVDRAATIDGSVVTFAPISFLASNGDL